MADVATDLTRPGMTSFTGDQRASTLAQVRRAGLMLAGYGLPFVLILYLAFQEGGYGVTARSEVSVVVWWTIALGCLCSMLPVSRPTRQSVIALTLFVMLLGWTALSLVWTGSTGRTVVEIARVSMLLGVMTLGVFIGGRDALRRTIAGAAAAIALVGLFAVLSKLQPGWFPEVQASALLTSSDNRLYYPLGYWNGLAGLMAVGLPLTLWMSSRARWVATRSVAAAAVPVICLAIYLTLSRGGMLAAAAGLAAFILLSPNRLATLPSLVAPAIGSAVMIAAAAQRPELVDAPIGTALGQGDELLSMLIVVALGVGLLQAAVALTEKHGYMPDLRPSRHASTATTVTVLGLLVLVALALNAPGKASDTWDEFRSDGGAGTGQARLDSSSGNGRYDYWQASVDAFRERPLVGQGPGTFEFWWAEHGTQPGFVRQAHSIYLQTLGEYGLVGFTLLLLLFATIVGTGVSRALRGRSDRRRSLAAAATAGFVAFAVGAIFDWSWEMTVIPVAALLIGGAVLGPDARRRSGRRSRFRQYSLPAPALGGVLICSVASLAVTFSVLAGSDLMEQSRDAFRDGEPDVALAKARQAGDLQPYAAEPVTQQALVLGYQGKPAAALDSAREATRLDPQNWRTWLVRSQVAASAGRANEAVMAFREFRTLNPRSSLAK